MLQNIKFNGKNINGTQGNRIGKTVAAGCDLSTVCLDAVRIDAVHRDLGKPLSTTSHTSEPEPTETWSYSSLSMGRTQRLHQRMHVGVASEVPVAVPAVLEPPAAAWATFVISRTTSV